VKFKNRKETPKGANFEKKLSSYALAGAALLAGPAVAHAGVIVTNVDEMFTLGGSPDFYTFTFPSSTSTVTIVAQTGSDGSGPTSEVDALVSSGAMILNAEDEWDNLTPAALGGGVLIDPSNPTNWGTGGKMVSYPLDDPFKGGNFPLNGSTAYLGFYFTEADGIHTGWADIATMATNGTASFEILDYGYQTSANATITTPLSTPEPSTMALIALGGAGLLALRRRRAANG
jgi:hypothetical protein